MQARQVDRAKILITGAAGFVGPHLITALQTLGLAMNQIVPAGLSAGALEATAQRHLNVTRTEDAEAIVKETQPTAVIHLAAVASSSAARADPVEAWQTNVFGTINMARAVLRHAPQAIFVFAGSSESYGDSFRLIDAPLDENVPLRPINTYATTKAAAEMAIGQFAHEGLKAVRFRPFNHTGPGQSAELVVASFARQIARIERGLQDPVIDVGNLDAERDFLDVRDVVRAYAAAATTPDFERAEAVFNLATARPVRIRSILQGLLALSSRDITVRIVPELLRPLEIARASGNPARVQQCLGWAPSISFDQTLGDVLTDWRSRVI